MDKMELIIKREFENASRADVQNVTLTEVETIIVQTAHSTFTMDIDCDDFQFVFVNDADQTDVVSFDFPEDWIVVLDE